MSSVKLRVCSNAGADNFKTNFHLLKQIDEEKTLKDDCKVFNKLEDRFKTDNDFDTCGSEYSEKLVTELLYQNQCSANRIPSSETFNYDDEDFPVSNELSNSSIHKICSGRDEDIDDGIASSSETSGENGIPSCITVISDAKIRVPQERCDGMRTILWAASFTDSTVEKDNNLEDIFKDNESISMITRSTPINFCLNGREIPENDVNGNQINHYSESKMINLNTIAENDDVKSTRSDDEDSVKSGKWDKVENNAVFDASSFYSSDNTTKTMKIPSVESHNLTSNMQEFDVNCIHQSSLDELRSESENHILNTSYIASPDSDSSRSMTTSGSGSTAFESAMSSSDMMTPFDSSKKLFMQNPSQSSQMNKIGINFANLTSENIPGTLNRIGAHKSNEKTSNDKKVSSKKIDKDKSSKNLSNHELTDQTNQNKPQSISNPIKINKYTERKLDKLNLLFLDKKTNSSLSSRKESMQKVSGKARESTQFHKDHNHKTVFNKTKKLITNDVLSETQQDKTCDITSVTKNDSDLGSSCSSFRQISDNNSKSEGCIKPQIKGASSNFAQSKSKFTSKIPRPISKTNKILQKTENMCDKISSIRYESKTVVNLSSKNDKCESISCSSGRSDCSYRKSSFKMKSDSRKTSSKTSSSNTNFNVIRSKIWNKESSQNRSAIIPSKSFNSNIIKREDTQMKLQSCTNSASPFRNTYGKMVRVKTAPIKSNGLLGDKLTKEPSRPDSAWKPGRSSPKLNWFNSSNTRSSHERHTALKTT